MDNAKCVHALTVQYVQPAAVAFLVCFIFPFISSVCFFFISFFFSVIACDHCELLHPGNDLGVFPLKKNTLILAPDKRD